MKFFGQASLENWEKAKKVVDDLKKRPKLVVEKVTSTNSAMLKCQNCGSKIIGEFGHVEKCKGTAQRNRSVLVLSRMLRRFGVKSLSVELRI